MRLDKFLADMSIGTRKEIKQMIRDKAVTVNGVTASDPGMAVSPDMVICIHGQPVQYETTEYYLMNKPAGVISASEDPKQKTVLDLIDERRRKDLFPVGRLDKDTVGLLLITNDGQLAHRMLAPKSHVDKTYFARVSGRVDQTDVEAFAQGLYVDESLTAMPASLKILSAGPVSEVEITIQEGKFHQVKRMFAARNKEVIYLKRISMGPLTLGDLPEGAYRRLDDEEIAALQEWG